MALHYPVSPPDPRSFGWNEPTVYDSNHAANSYIFDALAVTVPPLAAAVAPSSADPSFPYSSSGPSCPTWPAQVHSQGHHIKRMRSDTDSDTPFIGFLDPAERPPRRQKTAATAPVETQPGFEAFYSAPLMPSVDFTMGVLDSMPLARTVADIGAILYASCSCGCGNVWDHDGFKGHQPMAVSVTSAGGYSLGYATEKQPLMQTQSDEIALPGGFVESAGLALPDGLVRPDEAIAPDGSASLYGTTADPASSSSAVDTTSGEQLLFPTLANGEGEVDRQPVPTLADGQVEAGQLPSSTLANDEVEANQLPFPIPPNDPAENLARSQEPPITESNTHKVGGPELQIIHYPVSPPEPQPRRSAYSKPAARSNAKDSGLRIIQYPTYGPEPPPKHDTRSKTATVDETEPSNTEPTACNGSFTLTNDVYGSNLSGPQVPIPSQLFIPPQFSIPPRLPPFHYDILEPGQRGGKRGPFKDENLRLQTAATRKLGSCIRCRIQRIRCELDPDDPMGDCLTCKKVGPNSKTGRIGPRTPCLRFKLTEIRLNKPGQVPGFEWSLRWNSSSIDPVQKWADAEIKEVIISDGLSDHQLRLRVRKFIPLEGDRLDRSWFYNGAKRTVEVPPYALVDLEEAQDAFNDHIRASVFQALPKFVGDVPLLRETYHQALSLCRKADTPAEDGDLLQKTFLLWMSVRMSTTSYFIIGDERLGMPSNILDESPTPGKFPLPPMMGAQLDYILIHHIQVKLRKAVLEKLDKMSSKRKLNTWMVMYLVSFILLHNAALITNHDHLYARKHNMQRRFAREDKVKEYHLGANILLAYFHYCNRGVHPFSPDCKDQDLITLAGLCNDQVYFIHHTRRLIHGKDQAWRDLQARGAYENDEYFLSQLYDVDWEPKTTI